MWFAGVALVILVVQMAVTREALYTVGAKPAGYDYR